MKAAKIILGSLLFTLTSLSTFAQEFTLTTTNANIISSKASIDMPGLSGNPLAIIVATPIGGTATQNPHPIGAWYYSGKWNIFNTDHAVMVPGLKYKVQFFASPGPNQFLHLITQQNLGGEGSYIDNPALNKNPNAQLQILQNHAPDVRAGSALNSFEAQAVYSPAAGKWYITNVNGQLLRQGTAYNIVVSSGGGNALSSPFSNPVDAGVRRESCNCVIPTSLPPTGIASGDLSGSYPSPTVQKLSGKPLSNAPPNTGQVLKWNGTNWAPGDDSVGAGAGSSPSYSAGPGLSLQGTTFNALNTTAIWNASHLAGREITNTAPTAGQVLKWNGTAWAPADDNVAPAVTTPTASSMQTFFKSGTAASPLPAPSTDFKLTELTHTVTLGKKSRLVISAMITIWGDICPLGCPNAVRLLNVEINGGKKMVLPISVAANSSSSPTISNYMIDLNPGNYSVVFEIGWLITSSKMQYKAHHSSIMVIPLE